ncbi:MAG: ABC transporter permease [Luteibaculaceae bacterium]
MQNEVISENTTWDEVIVPQTSLLSINVKEILRSRDLLFLLVKRDVVTVYKQTILGPLWFVIQPVLTTLIFTVIFGNVAQIPTDGIPPVLFYLTGITFWNYFADCLTKVSDTFITNQSLFGKVYFPRIVVPLSITISNLIKLGIQFVLFLGFYIYFYFVTAEPFAPNLYVLLLPINIVLMAVLSLGLGMLITSWTTKYRDLKFLIAFGVQLAMYATPVVYPLSLVPEKYKFFSLLNPMTQVIESTKLGFLGQGYFSIGSYLGALVITTIIFIIGLLVFNKTQKSFMDTV